MATMAEPKPIDQLSPTCMESLNRISKLPVVESTMKTATDFYGKVKDYNSTTQWTCSTAENVVNKGVEVGKPIAISVVQNLEGPIKKVDGVLCTGLDYVESKVPAVKLPPGEMISQMYNSTKDLVNKTVSPAYSYVEPVVKTALEKIEPAMQTAKTVVDPALEKAQQLKNYGTEKLEQLLSCGHSHPDGHPECDACKKVAEKMESESKND